MTGSFSIAIVRGGIPVTGTMLGAIALLVLVGCGGGGGSGVAKAPSTPPPRPNTGSSLTVTVVDMFGEPIQAAKVFLNTGQPDTLTDANGIVRFSNVPEGEVVAYAHGVDSSTGQFYGFVSANVSANQQVETDITALPSANPVIGSAAAAIDAVEVSADGRSLTFRLSLLQVQDHNGWAGVGLSLAPCVPNASNDSPTFRADCVEGPTGFDSGYHVVDPSPSTQVTFDVAGTPQSYTAALLMDQSRRIVANDPSNLRLFGTKYLIENLAGNSLLLAAFAADGMTEPGLIDDRPVTVVATDAGTSSFEAIDDLATREGGASPLYAALDETIGLIAATPPTTGQRRVVVALTDGSDDTCGTPDQCRAARQVIVNKSAANDIDIVALVLPGGTEHDRRGVAELVAASDGGRAFWPDDPIQLPVLLGMLPEVLSRNGDHAEVTFRIEADANGTFVSGRTVHGTLTPEICPWDCYTTPFPIAVRVP